MVRVLVECIAFVGGSGWKQLPFTLLPAAWTFITTSSELGVGMGMEWIVVWREGWGWTITSFIVWVGWMYGIVMVVGSRPAARNYGYNG